MADEPCKSPPGRAEFSRARVSTRQPACPVHQPLTCFSMPTTPSSGIHGDPEALDKGASAKKTGPFFFLLAIPLVIGAM